MAEKQTEGAFVFEPADGTPEGSILYREHLKLTEKSHFAEFAGYLMPLWYSSIAAEHAAVRERAGIFDCTHMGVLEVMGGEAENFLNALTTNNVSALRKGAAQYSYILDAAGNVLDDIIVYRRAEDKSAGQMADKFMVVVNAANEPKVKAYLAAVQAGKAAIDLSRPERCLAKAGVRDMRGAVGGPDCRVDIALQGPASPDVLCKLGTDEVKKRVGTLKSFQFFEEKLAGIRCIISQTGYTGAKVGYELFVNPDSAADLWWRLLDAGKDTGVVPCGLGARDSLRIEAGLPLYGHELAGQHNISPFEAGYGWAVKLDKEFFIGKAAMGTASQSFTMKVARIEISGEKGVRPVRQKDAVISNGACIGWVLSCAKAGNRQIALVYVEKDKVAEGDSVGFYYLARSESHKSRGRKQTVERGEKVKPDVEGKTVGRFEKF